MCPSHEITLSIGLGSREGSWCREQLESRAHTQPEMRMAQRTPQKTPLRVTVVVCGLRMGRSDKTLQTAAGHRLTTDKGVLLSPESPVSWGCVTTSRPRTRVSYDCLLDVSMSPVPEMSRWPPGPALLSPRPECRPELHFGL